MQQIIRFGEVKGFQFLPSPEAWRVEHDVSERIFSWEILPERNSKLAEKTLGCVSQFWHTSENAENLPSAINGDIGNVVEVAEDFCCEYVYLWLADKNRWSVYEVGSDEDVLTDITSETEIDENKTFSVSSSWIEDGITAAIEHIKTLHSGSSKTRNSRDVFVDIAKQEFRIRELYAEQMEYIIEALIPELEKHPEAAQLLARTTGGLDEEIEPYDFLLVINQETEQEDSRVDQPEWVLDLMIDGIHDKHGICHFIHIDTFSKKFEFRKDLSDIVWERH